jgi:hypothetical protein
MECLPEEAMENRASASLASCRLERLPYLAENLRLAGHKRIEAGGDTEEVQRRRLVFLHVDMALDPGRLKIRQRGELLETAFLRRLRVHVGEVQADAIARRERDRFTLLC